MIKSLSTAAVLLGTVSFGLPALASPPNANFSVFYIQNSPASGMGNPGFCLFAAHDALEQNGFTNIGEDSTEVWGDNGDTLVYVSCVPYGSGSQWAGASVVAAGPVYATTESWRNSIRSYMQNIKWL